MDIGVAALHVLWPLSDRTIEKRISWDSTSGGIFHWNLNASPGFLRYGKTSTYREGDTVGCGIIMQTGTIFFTKNGVYLGKDCLILLPIRNGFLGLNSLTNRLQKKVL